MLKFTFIKFNSKKKYYFPWQDQEVGKPRESKCEDFDDLLDLVGAEGRFQKLFLYAVLGPVSLLAPLFMFNIIFMVYEPDHWCHVPGRDNETDLETWKNLTLPK